MRSRMVTFSVLCVCFPCIPGVSAQSIAPVVPCTSLQGVSIDSKNIGLPTMGAHVTSAEMAQIAGDSKPVCVVLGEIAPVDPKAPAIHFQLNLPSNWNGKAVQIGGGGYDGVLITGRNPHFIPPDREPVRLGYVTFGSDSGHQIADVNSLGGARDASFAMNHEALVNYGGAQLKKTHDAAHVLIARYYGRAPCRQYFYGSSQGGHEGLIVVQRFPADYDGVISIHPAYDLTALMMGQLALARTIYGTPGAWSSPEKTALVYREVLARCDALDGLVDGIISNLAACRASFDVRKLRCPDGKDTGPNCLSDAQIMALQKLARPTELGVDLSGVTAFSAWPVFEGAFAPSSRFGLGTRNPPAEPPTSQDAAAFIFADQGIRFFVLRDPTAKTLQFNPAEHLDVLRRASALLDASSTDLDAFRKHGGKLLLMHGTVDFGIPPGNTIAYYRRLQARYGDSLPSFVRFYLVPGFGHGDGEFVAQWDSLTALDEWVERGKVPRNQIVRDATPANKGRTRPLCEYPQWPRYAGSGDPNEAASFRCVP